MDTTTPLDISQETQWMLAVRDQRDRSAFANLFDHYAPRLKGMLRRSGTSDAQAEEVIQDVMLSVWHKADQFDPHRAQVSAWIFQMARNRHIDYMRKENRPVPEDLETSHPQPPDANQIVALAQEVGELRLAIEKLSPDQRSLIEQAYLGELSHSEIKNRTGLPLGTIKSRIRLGMQKLRHELKGLRKP